MLNASSAELNSPLLLFIHKGITNYMSEAFILSNNYKLNGLSAMHNLFIL